MTDKQNDKEKPSLLATFFFGSILITLIIFLFMGVVKIFEGLLGGIIIIILGLAIVLMMDHFSKK